MNRLHYRVGLPGWKVAAKVGMTLSFRAQVYKDKESGGFWANSPDIDGLVVSGNSLDELMKEITCAADSLLELELGLSRPADPIVRFDGAFCAA